MAGGADRGRHVDAWDDAPSAAAGFRGSPPSGSRASNSGNGFGGSKGHSDDVGSPTQVLSQHTMMIANDLAEAEVGSSTRLHQILHPPSDLVSDGWSSVERKDRSERNVKVRDLSNKYQEYNSRRSYLLEAFAAIIAMVVGIGFGCLVLKIFAPSLLDSIPFLKG
jgi:hypothetical protein